MQHTTQYRPEIDGLRALAILLVVVYHYFGVLGGYIGVDIFFVISGYLITQQIVQGLNNHSFSLSSFYAKRIRRILPALAVVICACLVYSWFFVFPTDFVLLGKHSAAGILNISNFVLWSEAGYFDTSSSHKPFLHFWSLGIEEQFYLVWPLLLIMFFQTRKFFLPCLISLTICSFILNVWTTQIDRTLAFYMPYTRFWELSAGGILAVLTLKNSRAGAGYSNSPGVFNHKLLPWFGFLLIAFATATLDHKSSFPGYWALLPVLGTCCLIAPVQGVTPGMGFLTSKPALFIGRISFGIYLWHWPVFILMNLSDLKGRPYKIIALLLSVLLAWVTYKFVEQPIRSIPVTRKNSKIFILSGLFTTLAIALAGWLIYSGNLKRSWDDTLISKPYDMRALGCGAFANEGKDFNPAIFDRCDKPQFPKAPNVMLLGDSHALSLYEGMKPYLDQRHINLFSYPILECTPLSLADKRPVCVQYNKWINEKIKTLKPDLVILFAHHLFRNKDPFYGEAIPYPEHLWKEAAQLKRDGVRNVMIIGGIPNWEDSLPHALNFNFLRRGLPVPERTLTYVVPESLKMDEVLLSGDNKSGVEFFSLKDALCNAQGCLTNVGTDYPEDLMVMDYGHMTRKGAKFIMEKLVGEKILELTR